MFFFRGHVAEKHEESVEDKIRRGKMKYSG